MEREAINYQKDRCSKPHQLWSLFEVESAPFSLLRKDSNVFQRGIMFPSQAGSQSMHAEDGIQLPNERIRAPKYFFPHDSTHDSLWNCGDRKRTTSTFLHVIGSIARAPHLILTQHSTNVAPAT
eukprot:scaffold124401_cov54-Attheya_sp.AAC.2